MKKIKEQLVLRKDDYAIMINLLRGGVDRASFDRSNAEELEGELKKAKLVASNKFPGDIVGLNSKVVIQEEGAGNVMELVLVTPGKADIKQRKISVLSPIGTALIGFKKGQQVQWTVPAGKKVFTIMDVVHL